MINLGRVRISVERDTEGVPEYTAELAARAGG